MSELVRLRSNLTALQAYALPDKYRLPDDTPSRRQSPDTGGNDNDDDGGSRSSPSHTSAHVFDASLLRRYRTARDAYVTQNTMTMFVECLETYRWCDGDDDDSVGGERRMGTVTLPPPVTDDERRDLEERQRQILSDVRETASSVNAKISDVRTKFDFFCEKREDLERIVEDLEKGERRKRILGDDDDDDDNDDGDDMNMQSQNEDDDDDDDVAAQDLKLQDLLHKRAALEAKIRTVKSRILDTEDDAHRTATAVNEIRIGRGLKPLAWRGTVAGRNRPVSPENNDRGGDSGASGSTGTPGGEKDDIDPTAECISKNEKVVEADIADIRKKIRLLRENSDYYDTLRETMEELGGIKILSIKKQPRVLDGHHSPLQSSDEADQNNKRRKLSGGGDGGGEELILELKLLDRHLLRITLESTKNINAPLSVASAKITSSATLPDRADDDDGAEGRPTITIPQLDDLVRLSHDLAGPENVRFLIIETIGRIRAMEARDGELRALREKYLSNILPLASLKSSSPKADARVGGGFAGEEQEVVCSLNQGITVALRLGADCPIMPGSVYVADIFGAGGWDDDVLEGLRVAVNEMRCRGPTELMDAMVAEIDRLAKEEGVVLPSTPTLPKRKH